LRLLLLWKMVVGLRCFRVVGGGKRDPSFRLGTRFAAAQVHQVLALAASFLPERRQLERELAAQILDRIDVGVAGEERFGLFPRVARSPGLVLAHGVGVDVAVADGDVVRARIEVGDEIARGVAGDQRAGSQVVGQPE